MKRLVMGFIALAGAHMIWAQEYSLKPDGDVSNLTVVIDNLFADLRIEGTNENEIRISASAYKGIPEKAKGLKPLSAIGDENTGIGLYIVQEGQEIKIAGVHRGADEGDYIIYLPRNINLKLDYQSWQAGRAEIVKMANEVEAKTQNGDIRFREVTGPIVAHSLSSDIEVIFSELNQKLPSSITSTSGDIDVTVIENSKGTFKFSSVSGEIFTNLDFEFDEKNAQGLRKVAGGMSAKGTLNGGGVDVTLRSVSGNIYIRKK
ncbi:MAG: DUF4097 family beta strand repeat protein [Cyclobacteriaceae bacterium]|nr:DUF4097 family beta strand repeat protein [Cyclobacteriaceae bacterium HetDA_MAG_MS6]